MDGDVCITFNELLLNYNGLSRGTGFKPIIDDLLTSATDASLGAAHFRKYGTGIAIPGSYDQQVFELVAYCEYLIRSPYVIRVKLSFEAPSAHQTTALIAATRFLTVGTMLAMAWHSDDLQDSFPGDWVEALDRILQDSYTPILPDNSTGVRIMMNPGSEVHFVPINRMDCLNLMGTGKQPQYSDLVQRIGCAPAYATLKVSNDSKRLF